MSDGCRRFPGFEPLHEELAQVLRQLGDVETALACAARSKAEWAPTFAFKLLIRHGRRAEAEQFVDAVAAARPTDPDLLEWRVRQRRKDPEKLLELCEDVLRHDPAASHGLYYKTIALAQLGRRAEAAALMAPDLFLQIAPLATPEDFGTPADFRETLRGEILANPTLHPDPAGHATRSGLRTGQFPRVGDRAAACLTGAIRHAVALYAERLSGDHPFVKGRPARARFTPWALVFRGGGHQAPHYHPGCWLTGVYYVSAVRDAGAGGDDHPGKIRIGLLPDWAGVEPPWPIVEVQPVPGTLLLFPSFVSHETVPPGAGAERISVAFDVAEVSGGGLDVPGP